MSGPSAKPRFLASLVSGFACASALILLCYAASRITHAGPPAGPSLSDLHERQRQLEVRKDSALRNVDERLQAQTIESGDALMERSRINHAYNNELRNLKYLEDQAFTHLEASQRRPSGGTPAPINPALPRFQSQSVIEYPGPDGTTPTETKPQREGRQKNVGFGTRELEF